MKVAFYLPNGIYGGGERVLIALSREFQKYGVKTVVYTRDIFDYSMVSTKVIRLNTQTNKIKQVFDAYVSFKQERIDRIIQFGCDTICFWASKLASVKYVYSLRVDPNQIKWNFMYRYIIHHCYKIVFQTQKVRDFFDDQIAKKSRVIFNPILDENLPNVERIREKKIVMVGRLSNEKNYPMALKAFSRIDRKGYKLHIYGKGPDESLLKNLVVSLGIDKDVIFEGQVSRVVDHIKKADIFLLTSNFEGMPNALIEGMAMGMACISVDFPSGAARELISDGKDGFVINMDDIETLSNRLQTLINDDVLRFSLQQKAQEIRNRQNMDMIVKQWIEFIA